MLHISATAVIHAAKNGNVVVVPFDVLPKTAINFAENCDDFYARHRDNAVFGNE